MLADPSLIEQGLGHLVANAYQAMEAGGTLTFEAEQTSGGSVIIHVKDTGNGIPQDTVGQVFEPLYTTKARGIGLGLAVTKRLVEANENSVKLFKYDLN